MDLTTENDAFLAALSAAPFDNAPRLIYADWLDEHDEAGKAEYLRLVADLREQVDDEGPLQRLVELAPSLAEDWRRMVGGCFETHLAMDSAVGFMKAVIQAMTFFTPKTAAPKQTEESPPSSVVMMNNLTREEVEEVLDQFRGLQQMRIRLFVKAMQPSP